MSKQVLTKAILKFLQEPESIPEKTFQLTECKDFQFKVQALKDFINFESVRSDGTKRLRNMYNLDFFANEGTSNPAFSCILFQKKLNIALQNKNLDTITEDGYFGTGTAKEVQRLLNAYLPKDNQLQVNGKIVSEIDTSKKTALVLDKMIVDNEPFVIELLEFIKNHGHIQQQGVFPIAKNADGTLYFGV
jgi:hypothetical protein